MEIDMAAPTPAPSTLAPTYPAFKEMRAPATMDFGEKVLTVTTTYANGHVYFNGTMLCNVGRQYNTEKAHDGVEKKVSIWSNANNGLLEKVVAKINEQPIRGKLVSTNFPPIGPLSVDDVIDTSNSKKKSGDPALRGTFVHIALFPALARYVSIDFAVHADALLARMFTGDYSVLADVIDICDNYNGTTTSKMAIDMDEVRESRKRSARAEELEDELPLVRKRVAAAEGRVRELEDIKEMMLLVLKEKNDIIAEKNSLIVHNKELAEYRLLRNTQLEERIATDPHTANANVLPASLDDNTFAERCEKFRQRVRDLVPGLVDAAFEGRTTGRTSTVRALIQQATGVLCLRLDNEVVSTLHARMMMQRACKIQFGVQYSTHMTAHMVYTVLSRGSKWLEMNVPGSSTTHNYAGTLQTFRNLYGTDLEPLDLLDCEDV